MFNCFTKHRDFFFFYPEYANFDVKLIADQTIKLN